MVTRCSDHKPRWKLGITRMIFSLLQLTVGTFVLAKGEGARLTSWQLVVLWTD